MKNTRMNPEIKARWVAALRSGEYKQGKGNLRISDHRLSDDVFCCLGVLCDLAVKAELPGLDVGLIQALTGQMTVTVNGTSQTMVSRKIYRYDENSMTLPSKIVDWAGLHSPNPSVSLTQQEGAKIYGYCMSTSDISLADCNDHGLDFEDIATVIEREL
jgi:hypothetical protein